MHAAAEKYSRVCPGRLRDDTPAAHTQRGMFGVAPHVMLGMSGDMQKYPHWSCASQRPKVSGRTLAARVEPHASLKIYCVIHASGQISLPCGSAKTPKIGIDFTGAARPVVDTLFDHCCCARPSIHWPMEGASLLSVVDRSKSASCSRRS